MAYRRMDMDVGALIYEVGVRPALWNKSCSEYTDRQLRRQAWNQVCKALYPVWGGFTQYKQGIIEKDVKTRWKTVRDRFFKHLREIERNGSSPSRHPKCPFYDELLFLLPNRSLRSSEGNYRDRESLADDQAEQEEQWESKHTPTLSMEVKEEPEDEPEDQAGPSSVATPPLDETTAAAYVTTTTARPAFPTRTGTTRMWSRRNLQAMDRRLEVESEALSLMRRVDVDDDCDFFGYGIAYRCRQMRRDIRDNFISYVYAAANVFNSANPLPELGDLINHLRSVTGLRDAPPPSVPRPGVVSTSFQSGPINLPAPPQLPTAGPVFHLSTQPLHISGPSQQPPDCSTSDSQDFTPPLFPND
ncbi:uncharacterized protein LOC142658855 [Rhinoderma darwinii]|uniref:uncharacterized protein LOC142658855 n=1 Tax=Rhinoderma darwinii TaxID=43563 RepID=UPI003F67E372